MSGKKLDPKLRDAALDYHRYPTPGKIKISATKALTNQKDLSLAYSPGVAAACELIVEDPAEASSMTSRANLVAVITNGTAVLGLGNIGALASKPVMEGKGVLFKKFADIDVFDIEVDESDPDKLIDIVASLEPTFGGINLEDIKAPECFKIEQELKERMNIPVFHDDQHGTAIICGAAVINALHIVGKNIEDVRLVASGAGAAGMACLDLLVVLGMPREHIYVCDRKGVIYAGREDDMNYRKKQYAHETDLRTLEEAMKGADIFLGVSAPGLVTPDMVKGMGSHPIIMALANPIPEILPDVAREARPDAIIATGRSDYPNQVNNVLCFPYIFRGALDVGATGINDEMKMACVHAIANLARREVTDTGATAEDASMQFGAEYLIPRPFDPRLIAEVAPAVARAAMDSGVATRDIEDFDAYVDHLNRFVFRTGMLMKPVFEAAKANPKRVVYAEGENEKILRAVQTVIDDGLAEPILIGRPSVVENRIEKLGLRMTPGEDFELVNPESDPRYNQYWSAFHEINKRRGVTPDVAKAHLRTRPSIIAAVMVYLGEADAMITGVVGRYNKKLHYVTSVLGSHTGSNTIAAMSVLTTERGSYFITDTHVNTCPTAEEIAEITLMAAEKVRMFGIVPKVALLSHSAFGSHDDDSARKMQKAMSLVREMAPDLEVEGEMSADMALSEEFRNEQMPNALLKGPANLLVMPDLDSAHISFNLSRVIADAVSVGPILLGIGKPAHVLTTAATVRRVINMTAVAVVDAQAEADQQELFADNGSPNGAEADG